MGSKRREWKRVERDNSLEIVLAGDLDEDEIRLAVEDQVRLGYLFRRYDSGSGGLRRGCADPASLGTLQKEVQSRSLVLEFSSAFSSEIDSAVEAAVKAELPEVKKHVRADVEAAIRTLVKQESSSSGYLVHVLVHSTEQEVEMLEQNGFEACIPTNDGSGRDGILVQGVSGFAVVNLKSSFVEVSESDIQAILTAKGVVVEGVSASLKASVERKMDSQFKAVLKSADVAFFPVWIDFYQPKKLN